jgi:hypothetical protein
MSKEPSRLKREKHPMPVFVKNALNDRGLMAAYRAVGAISVA